MGLSDHISTLYYDNMFIALLLSSEDNKMECYKRCNIHVAFERKMFNSFI